MGLVSGIAPNLPYLRRYSRALTGDQISGDAYVAALLEAIIADPTEYDASQDIRLSLYKGFCRLWESVSINMQIERNEPAWETATKRQLSAISPKAREAFLLSAVEGFSTKQIGEILLRTTVEVADLLDEASNTITNQVATDALIIEDEPIIAMDLESVLDSLGHKVTGIARTESDALRLAAATRPGLILADIQLADGSSGIDAVNKILQSIQVPVVFITAFPERLLTGERPEPAFLITKPFMPEMVKAVVSQALFFDAKSRIGE